NRRPGNRRRWPRCRSYLVVIIPLLKGTGGCCNDRSASPCPLLNPLKAHKPPQVTAKGLNRPQTGCRGLIPYNLYVCFIVFAFSIRLSLPLAAAPKRIPVSTQGRLFLLGILDNQIGRAHV